MLIEEKIIEDVVVSETMVIDCRFRYEFEGGHVQGAYNVSTPQEVSYTTRSFYFVRPTEFESPAG